MSRYVDSLHVSVREGDCAIHLLVDDTGSRPQVKAAVLMDGGMTHDVRDSGVPTTSVTLQDPPLQQTMDWINRNYTCDGGKLMFDTIVITHWDGDHYNGITEALKNAAVASIGPANIPWLKWGPAQQPETRLYCPALGFPADKYRTVNGRVSVKYGNNQFYEFALYRQATNTAPWPVLGVELFQNRALDVGHQRLLSPSELIQAHGNLQPGLYCVAVSKLSLGRPTLPALPTITGPDTSEKNLSSIAAMVMWPGSSGSPPPRVSHYFAGDLDDFHEQAILDWLKAEKIEKITSVKLNHHGSSNSTPLELFTRFQPDNTFIPAPINGRHTHPSKLYPTIVYSTLITTDRQPGLSSLPGTPGPRAFLRLLHPA
jgi:hypothetical protein